MNGVVQYYSGRVSVVAFCNFAGSCRPSLFICEGIPGVAVRGDAFADAVPSDGSFFFRRCLAGDGDGGGAGDADGEGAGNFLLGRAAVVDLAVGDADGSFLLVRVAVDGDAAAPDGNAAAGDFADTRDWGGVGVATLATVVLSFSFGLVRVHASESESCGARGSRSSNG